MMTEFFITVWSISFQSPKTWNISIAHLPALQTQQTPPVAYQTFLHYIYTALFNLQCVESLKCFPFEYRLCLEPARIRSLNRRCRKQCCPQGLLLWLKQAAEVSTHWQLCHSVACFLLLGIRSKWSINPNGLRSASFRMLHSPDNRSKRQQLLFISNFGRLFDEA